MIQYVLILTIFFTLCLSTTELINSNVLSINGTIVYNETLGTFPYRYSTEIDLLNGFVAVIDRECDEDGYVDVDGMIVIVQDTTGCSNRRKTSLAIAHGAIGIGFAERVAGVRYLFNNEMYEADRDSIAVFSVSDSDRERYVDAFEEGMIVFLTLNVVENEAQVIFESVWWTVMQSFFLIVLVFTGIYITWKLVKSVEYQGYLSILTVSLSIEIGTTIVKILFLIDPIGSRGLYSDSTSKILFSLMYAPNFIVQLLISLYWMEAFNAADVSTFLKPFSLITLGISTTFLFIISILSALSGLIFYIQFIRYVFYVVLSLFLLLLNIFYIFVVYKLINLIWSSEAVSKKRKNKAKPLLVWYIISAIFSIMFQTIAALSSLFSTPATYVLWYIFVLFLSWILSLSKIIPINYKGKYSSKSRTVSKSNTKSNTKSKTGAKQV